MNRSIETGREETHSRETDANINGRGEAERQEAERGEAERREAERGKPLAEIEEEHRTRCSSKFEGSSKAYRSQERAATGGQLGVLRWRHSMVSEEVAALLQNLKAMRRVIGNRVLLIVNLEEQELRHGIAGSSFLSLLPLILESCQELTFHVERVPGVPYGRSVQPLQARTDDFARLSNPARVTKKPSPPRPARPPTANLSEVTVNETRKLGIASAEVDRTEEGQGFRPGVAEPVLPASEPRAERADADSPAKRDSESNPAHVREHRPFIERASNARRNGSGEQEASTSRTTPVRSFCVKDSISRASSLSKRKQQGEIHFTLLRWDARDQRAPFREDCSGKTGSGQSRSPVRESSGSASELARTG